MADNNESKEVIKLDFQTNADDAAKDVNGLNVSIEKTTETTKKANAAEKDLAETKHQSAKATKSQSDALGELDKVTGGAIEQVKGLAKSFLALLANPVVLFITLIVGALALLYKAFTSTNDGADKMEQVFAGIGAAVDVLRDRVLKVGGAIAKFFSGDFKGAISDARTAVSGIGDEIASEFKKAGEATAYLQDVEDAMRDLGVTRAKLNRDLAQSKELITDENASYAQKKKAIDDVRKAEELQSKQEIAAAEKKLDAIKRLNALSDTSDEALQRQADAEAALYDIQTQSAQNRRNLDRQERAADAAERARLKAITDARKAAAKEKADLLKKELEEEQKRVAELYKISQDFLKKQNDLEKASLDEIDRVKKANSDRLKTDTEVALENERIAYQTRLDNAIKFGQDTEDIELNHANNVNDIKLNAQNEAYKNQKELDEKALAAKKANQQALVDGAEQLIKNVQQLAGKNKAIQKAAIIADGAISLGKAGVNTAEAVTKDLAKGAPFSAPLVALDIAVGATSAAAIIQNTSKALQAVGGGSAPSAPALPSARTSANAQPQTGFQASSENQIATSINSANKAPQIIKSFVVGSEVTDQQTLDAKLIGENSFGGTKGG